MFTGIVETIGKVVSKDVDPKLVLWDGSVGEGVVLTIACSTDFLKGCYIGASIAVNGVCLTVTSFSDTQATFGLAPETLRRTNLDLLQSNDIVNLERSAKIGDRNSGHFVQGHVDCTATISKKTPEGDSLWIELSVPKEFIKYIVPKGYVAIDGTSLTVCEVDAVNSTFTFMLVQYTQNHVIIPKKPVGGVVNIEVDVLGKYSYSAVSAIMARMDALEAKVDSVIANGK